MENFDRYDNNETAPTKVVSPGLPSTECVSEDAVSEETVEAVGLSSRAYCLSQVDQDSLSQPEQSVPSIDAEQYRPAQRLQRQVSWLKFSLVAAVFIFGGALSGVFWGLRQEQLAIRDAQGDLTTKVETVEEALSAEASSEDPSSDVALPTISLPSAQQINQLSEKVRLLSEQAKTLSAQAAKITEHLPDVSIEGAAQQWTELSERLSALEQALQNGVTGEDVSDQIDQLGEKLSQWLAQVSLDTSAETGSNVSESSE